MTVIWLIVIAAVILAVIVAALVRRDDPFKAAATGLGLKLTRTVPDLIPNLDGLVNGMAVKVDVAGSREPTVRYEVFYPELGMALRLERETTITRTLGQLGNTDPQVGSKPFDDSFRINTSRPDALRTMMTPERRRNLIHLIETYPKVVIGDGSIVLLSDTLEPSADTIKTTVSDLVAAAETLVAGRPEPLKAPEPPPPPPRAATPSPPAAKAAPAQEARPSPTAPPTQQQDRPEPKPTPAPRPAPEQPPPAIPSTGLPSDFFDNVFGANRLSFEDEGQFDEKIRGTQVNLSGTVKQASPYAGDDDLAPTAGTKAVITVAQIDNDLYGKTDIDAVVFLTSETSLDRGDTVTFTGTIEKVDPYMRNVFVTEAAVSS
ncbi:MAG: hypothetical protein GY926_20325 [bacterium]|nr:hypothetical protein [bacterium]